jgi:hypothetical protein
MEKFSNLSINELKRGVELLVAPEDLRDRRVLAAILKALEFSPEDVKTQIKLGEQLNAGPALRF